MAPELIYSCKGDLPDGSRDEFSLLRRFLTLTPVALSYVRGPEAELFSRLTLERPVLDVGCGDGMFMSNVYDGQLDAGIDISPREIMRARRRNTYKDAQCISVSTIPYGDQSFKSIVSNCVFEHLPDLPRAFAELYRVLKPGGAFYFTTHSDLYKDCLLYPRLLKKLRLPGLSDAYLNFVNSVFKHYNCLSPQQWSTLLSEAGFSSITYQYYLPVSNLSMFDLLLPLSLVAYLNKNLLGKWVLLPRRWIWQVFQNHFRRTYRVDCEKGGGLFIVARKE